MAVRLDQHEQKFVQEFVKDLNPVLACQRMGYDEDLAYDAAYEFLGSDKIKEGMAEALVMARKFNSYDSIDPKDFGVSENYIMLRLKSIADRAPKDSEKLKALELLGKSIGMFKDISKIDITETKKSAFTETERAELRKRLAERKANETARAKS